MIRQLLGCRHPRAWWPRRLSDGRDWQYCPDCQKSFLSEVQFDLPAPRPLMNGATTGIQRMHESSDVGPLLKP